MSINKEKLLVFCLILSVLILISVVVYYILNIEDKSVEKVNINNEINRNEDTINVEEGKQSEKESISNIYDKYSKFEFKRTTKIEFLNDKIEIENGKLYYTTNDTKTLVTSVMGTPKYIAGFLEGGTIGYQIVITEEGTIWKAEEKSTANNLSIDFKKVEIDGTVIEMTTGIEGVKFQSGPYFLIKEGKLLNDTGKTYEEINGDHIDSYGTVWEEIYISEDKTISKYISKTDYVKVKDEKGNLVKVKQIFGQNILEGYRFYIITTDDKFLYIDYKSLVSVNAIEEYIAKEYQETLGEKVKKFDFIKIPLQSGGSKENLKLELQNGNVVEIMDINNEYYDMLVKKHIY